MRVRDIMVSRMADVTSDMVEQFIVNTKDREFSAAEMNQFDEAMKRLRKFVKPNSPIYRAVSIVGDPIEVMKKNINIGTSWSYDPDSAEVFRDDHRGFGEKYILVTQLDENTVDWIKTVALNMIPIRGNFEREIRLKLGKRIKLQDMLTEDFADIIGSSEILRKVYITK